MCLLAAAYSFPPTAQELQYRTGILFTTDGKPKTHTDENNVAFFCIMNILHFLFLATCFLLFYIFCAFFASEFINIKVKLLIKLPDVVSSSKEISL